ncbi:MAG: hypothetical protein ABII72_02410, partial [Parcubacteria group bacterium]
MNKLFLFYGLVIVGGFLVSVGVVTAAPADSLQPASTITHSENLVVNGSGQFGSVHIGSQGIGGVTYFNGSIVNSTTGDNGSDNPVTFGDSVRIDGAIMRGTSDQSMPVRIGDDLRVDGQLWGGTHKGNTADGQSLVVADTIRPAHTQYRVIKIIRYNMNINKLTFIYGNRPIN